MGVNRTPLKLQESLAHSRIEERVDIVVIYG